MPRLKIHRNPTAKPFVGKKTDGTSYSTHYRFSAPSNGSCYVAIHIGCYYKGLQWLNQMFEHMKAQMPFEAVFDEPEVEILDGPCYKRMPSVQARIKYNISDIDAHNKLVAAGFFKGLEYTIS